VIELLELSLGARGATIDTAADAEAFHAHLDDGSYDAVLVDLSPLGGEIGDVCERVRERNPDTNIIVISGSITAQPRPDVTWVRKPFEPSELARAIVGDDD
jgi:DNA-binding response OmpR family regulator